MLSPVSSRHKCRGDGLVGAINYSPPPLDLPVLLPSPLLASAACAVATPLNFLVTSSNFLSVPTTSSTAPSSSSGRTSGDCYDQIGEERQEEAAAKRQVRRWWLLPARG